METAELILFWLYFALICVSILAVAALAVAMLKVNRIIANIESLSDDLRSALSKVIPAILNTVTIAEGIRSVLEAIAVSKKSTKKESK